MIIAGYEYTGKKPFKNVYLTGLVRDKQRRKMSKSLGNSPDALQLIQTYSADGVRVGLLLSAAAGNDLMFDEGLCQQGKGFSNKIWNAFKLTQSWDIDTAISQPESSKIAINWYQSRLQQTLIEIEDHYSKYRISDALMASYKLVWDDFCGWLLEIIKPAYQAPIDKKTYDSVIAIFEDNLRILHPFMPFLTEELWHAIAKRTPQEALIVNHWPKTAPIDKALLTDFEFAAEVVSGIRTIRKEKNIAFKDAISLSVINTEKVHNQFDVVIKKLGNINEMTPISNGVEGALTFRVKSNEYFIPIEGAIDVEQEILKLKEELKYTQGFLKSVQGKLKNQKFVSGAPQQVVDNERKKEADAIAKIETIETSIKNLS
jgi:valyl-tRNA synthetase